MKTTRHELHKVDANGSETFVWFTPSGDTVSVYTWAPHTDYTNRFVETVEVARASWRDLLSRGFKFVRTFQSDPPPVEEWNPC